jgi:mannopine transport system permease protein
MTKRHAAIFLSPVGLVMAFGFFVPLAQIFYTSVEGARLTAQSYAGLIDSRLFWLVLQNTFAIGVESVLASLLLAYPIAYHLSRATPGRRAAYMVLVLLPFWTSILVKSFAFTVILGDRGIINNVLRALLGESAVLPLLFNRTGVVIGMLHWLLPFMVFPILVNLLAQGSDLHYAARVMGASRSRIFLRITLPLSIPGVLAGCVITLVLSLGSFVTPALLGGRRDLMMASLVDFYTRVSLDWATASAIAVLLLAITGGLILLLSRLPGEHRLI